MFREIREIPPAPREVRWRAVLWHRWPIALLGFALAVYGGAFTLMLFFAAGGKASDDARLDRRSRTAVAEITDVWPLAADGTGVEQVIYAFEDAWGQVRDGASYAEAGLHAAPGRATVEYLAEEPGINRLEGTQLSLLPAWVEPSLFLGLLVLPGMLALGLWMDLAFYYFIGWAIAVSLLALENGLIKADDLSKLRSPLFQYNSVISMVLLVFTILAVEL